LILSNLSLFLIFASTCIKHLVQQGVPSEAVANFAPAHPTQGVPQLGHATFAIVVGFYLGLT
jgi:hypothetical protein